MLPRRPDPTAGAKGAHCATSARSVKHDWQSGSRDGGKSAFFLRGGAQIIGWYVPSSRCEAAEHVSAATSARNARVLGSMGRGASAGPNVATRLASAVAGQGGAPLSTPHALDSIYQPLIATVCLWGCRFIAAEIARTVARGENRTEAARTLFLMP